MVLISLTTLIVLVIDQITKYIIISKMSLGESIPILSDIFHLTLVHNRGVAFGLFNNNQFITFFLIVIGCCVIFYIISTIRNLSFWHRIATGMMVGGAIGNIVDRIRVGAVIDFLDFRIWPVFNVADSAISVAAGIFIILIITVKK